jgi:hypothetical protein
MKNRSMVGLLSLAVLAAFLGLGSLVHAAVDNPSLNDARTDLHDALNPGGPPLSLADKTKLVKAALDSLKQVPEGGYRGHLKSARSLCETALDVLGKGDPDDKAKDYIRQALEEVRDLTD